MVSSWLVVQSTWLERERVHFSRERGRSRERESAFSGERGIQKRDSRGRSIQERGEFLEGEEKCVLGI